MKNVKNFLGMLFLSLLLILQIAACGKGGDDAGVPAPIPGKPFITSDLNGTWYLYGTNGAGFGGSAGNLRGKLILDSLGNVSLSGSTYTRSNGAGGWSLQIQGGLIGVDLSGALTGSANISSTGGRFYIDSGKMDSSKNIMSFVAHTDSSTGENYLVTAVRSPFVGFPSLDLAGTWYVFGSGGDDGKITVADGSDGIRATITAGGGGFFAIDGSGLLNDNISGASYNGTSYVVTRSATILSLAQGKMTDSKNMMFFVTNAVSSSLDLVTAIRAGGTFAASDLSGTWSVYGASSSINSPSMTAALSGTMTLDSSGKVTGVSYTRTDSAGVAFVPLTSGTITIDSAGVLGGSAGNMTFTTGKMNAAKGVMALVGASGTERIFLYGLKGN